MQEIFGNDINTCYINRDMKEEFEINLFDESENPIKTDFPEIAI